MRFCFYQTVGYPLLRPCFDSFGPGAFHLPAFFSFGGPRDNYNVGGYSIKFDRNAANCDADGVGPGFRPTGLSWDCQLFDGKLYHGSALDCSRRVARIYHWHRDNEDGFEYRHAFDRCYVPADSNTCFQHLREPVGYRYRIGTE